MQDFLKRLNKVFDHRVRLALMAALLAEERIEFNTLKRTLSLTDGSLASHIATLEKCGYLNVTKTFVGKKTQTTYAATTAGRKAFHEHLSALQAFLTSTPY